MGQERAPLLEALYKHGQAGRIPFHVPAHLGRPLPGFGRGGEGMFSLDVTELPGLDDLHCPTGPLKLAQDLAAELFGARKTFFLVNGVTAGVLAAHLYYGGKGKTIILPRDAHRSHYGGLILAGSTPVYLPTARQEGIGANVTLDAVREALGKNPEAAALFVTSPGYHGACADLPALREETGKKGIPLVVDEAHGTYLSLSPRLPPGAGDVHADMWFQSTHKTGGSLTQGGMLHAADGVDVSRLAFLLSLVQTSSPSYPIMASLDEARRVLAREGRQRAERAALRVSGLRKELKDLRGVNVVEFSSFASDPLKLTLSLGDMPGREALTALRQEGVEPELAGFCHVLFVISLFHTSGQIEALKGALKGVLEVLKAKGPWPAPIAPPLPLPRQILSPGEGAAGRTEVLPLNITRGRIAAEMVVPSPPGIPLLVPGEEVTPEVLEYLAALKRTGLGCQMGDPQAKTLKVLVK